MLTYEELFTGFRKGIRNGNWKRLRFLDKALYRAAMWYVKRGGSIVNEMLAEKLGYLKGVLEKRLKYLTKAKKGESSHGLRS
jgi:hypothetical protein